MNKKRILHLQPFLNYSCGITRTIVNITSSLENKYDFLVASFGGNAFQSYSRKYFKYCFQFKNYTNRIFRGISLFFQLWILVKKQKIDIIHCHHREMDVIAFFVSKFVEVKIITSVQSIVEGGKKLSYRAKILIVASNAVKNHLISYFKIDETRIRVVYNFVVPNKITLNKEISVLKSELKITHEKKVLLFIGRFDREKGTDILLRAFEELSETKNNVVLLMVGCGNLEISIQEYISNKNLNIKIMESRSNPFDFYNIADIVILPSRIDPFPLVMLEAGYMSRAFIGTAVDGIAELIENNKTGILVEKENYLQLANAIEALLNDTSFADKLGVNLNKKIIEKYTNDKVIPKYEEIYSSC